MHGAQQRLWMHAWSLQKCMWTRISTYIYTYRHVHTHYWCCFYYFVRNSLVALLEALCARICIHAYIDIYIYTYLYTYIYTCAYAPVQQFLCHGSYCKLILSLAQASCRMSFLLTLLPLCRAGRPPASTLFAVETCAAPHWNIGYLQVPGSKSAENPKTKIHMDLSWWTLKQGF